MVSDSDRIRLAVALVAVKFKPPDLSFASYILDLRSKFPPSTPPAPATENPWRTHALSVERSYAELQAKYEAEIIKSLAAEHSASSISRKNAKKKSPTTETSEPVPAPETLPKSDCRELKSILKKLYDNIDVPVISDVVGSDSVLLFLNNVLQLASVPDPQPALLLSVTIRTIEAISDALKAIILRSTPNVPSEINTLKMLSTLLYHMLDVVIPFIMPSPSLSASPIEKTTRDAAAEEFIDTLLERTSTLILSPLIHSFAPLSQNFLDAAITPSAAGSATNATTTTSAGSSKPPGPEPRRPAAALDLPADVRGDTLSLFGVVFRALDTRLQQQIPHSPKLYLSRYTLQASLILETVRELERISPSVPVTSLPSAPGGNTEEPVGAEPMSRNIDMGKPAMRVKRLAMKDARWYMCAILHAVLSETLETSSIVHAPLTVSITPEKPEAGGNELNEVEARRDLQARVGHLLDKGISDVLYRLVTKCKKTAPSPCHYETRAAEFNELRGGEVLGQTEKSTGTDKQDSHVQLQGHSSDRTTAPSTPTYGGTSGKPEVQSAISESGLDVGPDTGPVLDVGANAGGRLGMQSSRPQGEEMVAPEPRSSNGPEVVRGDEIIDLDEIEHGMLLAVIEKYWVWSESQKC